MWVILMFGELNYVCFHASDYTFEGQGNTANQAPQFIGFLLSKFIKRFNVSLQNQHQPPR
ncbi:MAG: hypothetical protein OXH16_14150 [Gemmatimonadetes bacterium]|nr:hypothetical protein [Gemmatimonadota bacterium]